MHIFGKDILLVLIVPIVVIDYNQADILVQKTAACIWEIWRCISSDPFPIFLHLKFLVFFVISSHLIFPPFSLISVTQDSFASR